MCFGHYVESGFAPRVKVPEEYPTYFCIGVGPKNGNPNVCCIRVDLEYCLGNLRVINEIRPMEFLRRVVRHARAYFVKTFGKTFDCIEIKFAFKVVEVTPLEG